MPHRLPVFLFLLALCLVPSPAVADMVLVFNNAFSPSNRFSTEVLQYWADEVHTITDGRVTIRLEHSGKLSRTNQNYESLNHGYIDIGLLCPMYYPDKLKLGSVFDLPMVTSLSAEKSSVAAADVFLTSPAMQEEFAEFEVLWIFITAPYHFHSMHTPVINTESLKGKRFTTGGAVVRRTAELLGAVPRNITMSGVLPALQNGHAEGCLMPSYIVEAEGLAEYLRYHLDESILATSAFVVVKKATWEALPKEDREAIWHISGRVMSERSGKVIDEMTEVSRQNMLNKGDVFTRLSRQEHAQWLETMRPLWDDWIERSGYAEAGWLLQYVIRSMQD